MQQHGYVAYLCQRWSLSGELNEFDAVSIFK